MFRYQTGNITCIHTSIRVHYGRMGLGMHDYVTPALGSTDSLGGVGALPAVEQAKLHENSESQPKAQPAFQVLIEANESTSRKVAA